MLVNFLGEWMDQYLEMAPEEGEIGKNMTSFTYLLLTRKTHIHSHVIEDVIEYHKSVGTE